MQSDPDGLGPIPWTEQGVRLVRSDIVKYLDAQLVVTYAMIQKQPMGIGLRDCDGQDLEDTAS